MMANLYTFYLATWAVQNVYKATGDPEVKNRLINTSFISLYTVQAINK